MTKFRSSASFGKRQEFGAIAELMKRNFDVYMTLVDDQQIDCIIRLDKNPPVYIDIQIKARSSTAKYAGTFANMEVRLPRSNFFYIFYSEPVQCYWVIPSEDVVRKANVGKSGKSKGRFAIVLANKNSKGEWKPRPKWEEYKNKFDLLLGPK